MEEDNVLTFKSVRILVALFCTHLNVRNAGLTVLQETVQNVFKGQWKDSGTKGKCRADKRWLRVDN
jgi:hypothetical protein